MKLILSSGAPMDVMDFVIAIYVVATVFALCMTYREQRRRGQITPVFTLIGYCLCLVWPLVVAVMALGQYAGIFADEPTRPVPRGDLVKKGT